MKLIELADGIRQTDVADLVLLDTSSADDADASPLPVVGTVADDGITAMRPADYVLYGDEPMAYVYLTADDHDTPDMTKVKKVLIYVKDFKDGRVFSVIRQIRQINTHASIIVAGKFGLDQSGYFVRSGASGFLVDDDKVATLILTLNDLNTAQSRHSASSLPMFR